MSKANPKYMPKGKKSWNNGNSSNVTYTKATVQPVARPPQNKQRGRKPLKQVDARFAKTANTIVSNTLKTDPIVPKISVGAIAGVPVEYISRALSNGFYSVAGDPGQAFGAANWIYRTIQTAMTGSTPLIQSGPKWLVQLCKCIAAKQARLGSQTFSYKSGTGLANVVDLPALVPVGPPQYNYFYNFSIPDDVVAPVDGFPVSQPSILPADGGAMAWQDLVQFLQGSHIAQEQSVQFNVPLHNAEKTVSIFAVNFDQRGGGKGGVGGYYSLCGSETPVYQPLLSLMGASLQEENVPTGDRVSYFTRKVAGDSLWMTNVMSTLPFPAWEQDRPTHFHSIDFLEFGSVLATWASKLVSLYLQDGSNIPEVNEELTPTSFQCPLTLQEFLLLLRNEMMMLFKRTQPAVQSLYPLSPVSGSDNQFTAYLSSATSCAFEGTGIKLPQSIVENLRSLTERYYFYGKKANEFEWWVPVLGQYVLDELDTNDYNYTSNIGGISEQIPVFAPSPSVQVKKFDKDGKASWKVMAEDPIDLIDGYCAGASATGAYLFINDTARLTQLATVWNDWIAIYDAYSDPLVNLATEAGPLALCSISTTRSWIVPQISVQKRHESFRDDRLKKFAADTTVYANRKVVNDTFSQAIEAPLYESIQSKWILPTNRFQVGSAPNNRSTLQAYMSQFSEGNVKIRSSDGEDSVSLASIHTNLAMKMVHAKNAQPNEWIEAFKNASAKGQGGMISGLIAKFAGAAFGDTVGSVAGVLADCLPI